MRAFFLGFLLAIGASAQVVAPQVSLTGNIGPAGSFPLLNSGSISFATDANHTMVYPEFTALSIKVTSAVPLTATRNLVTPAGRFQFIIENLTTGGQSIQVIGASGTGVMIANGTGALIWNDGTNYIAVTGGSSTPVTPSSPSHMELASLGQNANLNGAMPFIGSAAYNSIAGNAVDTANNSYFHTAIGAANFDASQVAPGSDLPYYILNSKTDPGVYWVPLQTDYEAGNPGSYDTESDHTMIPLKAGIQGEGGRDITTCLSLSGYDIHGTIIDVATNTLYAGYQTRVCNGVMHVYSMTIHNLDRPFEVQEPRGRTTEDVAGMVAWPGILGVRKEDLDSGVIPHALRITMKLASRGPSGFATLFTGMASHGGCNGGNCSSARATIFGQRYKLPSNYDCVNSPSGTPWTPYAAVVCNTLKTYGAINADNGINCAIQGTSSGGLNLGSELSAIACSSFAPVVETNIAYAAQVPDENYSVGGGGTSQVINQTAIFDNGSTGPSVANPTPKPTITSFTASATSVAIGQPVTFSYSGTNITSAFIDNAGGTAYGNSGSITWTPTDTFTYQMTAKGMYGWTYSTPVTVTVTGTPTPSPTSSVATGTYTTPQNATLLDSQSGAKIYYTLDGSTPGVYSALYSSPLVIQTNGVTTLKMIAVASGFLKSAVVTYTYTLNLPSASAPTFSVPGGSYSTAQSVALATTTPSSSIYYSLDGSTPSTGSTYYTAPIAVPAISGVQVRTQLNAVTSAYGYADAISTATYLIGTQGPLNGTANTTQSYGTGHFSQAGTFTPASAAPYPYVALPAGFSPLNATDGFTMSAWVKTTSTGLGWFIGNGDEQGGGLAIASRYGNFVAYSPTGNSATGELNSGLPIADGNWHYVKATYSTAGVKTFVDGVAGATSSVVVPSIAAGSTDFTQYEIGATTQGRFGFSGSLDEIAVRTGVDNSLTVPSVAYTGSETGMFALYHLDGDLTDSTVRGMATVATPTFSPVGGTYSSTQTVSITSATSGAAIYYTTNGSTPTTASALYSGPLTVSATTTVKALATHSGYTNSAIGTATYTISGGGGGVAFVGNSDATVGLSYTPTATYSFTGGNLGIVMVGFKNGSGSAPVLTCNSTTGTLQGYQQSTNAYVNVAIYTLPNVAGGSTTCTIPSGVNNAAIIISEFSGASTSTPVEGVVSANSGTDPIVNCGSVVTTGSGRLLIASAMVDVQPVSASSGYTTLFNDVASDHMAQFSLAVPTATTTAATVTSTTGGNDKTCVALAVKP